jgi:hypothetical protein
MVTLIDVKNSVLNGKTGHMKDVKIGLKNIIGDYYNKISMIADNKANDEIKALVDYKSKHLLDVDEVVKDKDILLKDRRKKDSARSDLESEKANLLKSVNSKNGNFVSKMTLIIYAFIFSILTYYSLNNYIKLLAKTYDSTLELWLTSTVTVFVTIGIAFLVERSEVFSNLKQDKKFLFGQIFLVVLFGALSILSNFSVEINHQNTLENMSNLFDSRSNSTSSFMTLMENESIRFSLGVMFELVANDLLFWLVAKELSKNKNITDIEASLKKLSLDIANIDSNIKDKNRLIDESEKFESIKQEVFYSRKDMHLNSLVKSIPNIKQLVEQKHNELTVSVDYLQSLRAITNHQETELKEKKEYLKEMSHTWLKYSC